jgi:Zn-dependent protease
MSGPAASFGQVGQSQSQDCSLDAGTLFGVPIKVSYFLLIYFVGNVMEATKGQSKNVGWALAYAISAQLILFATVLCHEFGHGTMAKTLGGRIMHIFLWPFGGICFSTRPQRDYFRDRVRDELKIVVAGPATHIPMAALWCGLVTSVANTFDFDVHTSDFFTNPMGMPRIHLRHGMCNNKAVAGCTTEFQLLCLRVACNGVSTNVMLFLFNVFFPMYPMDSAKIIVCTLQLCCRVRYKKVAWILVGLSGLAGACMIGNTLWKQFQNGGSSPLGNLPLFLAVMSLLETYRIYKMLKDGNVHQHPLFLGADQEPDQAEPLIIQRPPRVVVPVSSSGTTGSTESTARSSASFLDRLQARSQEQNLSVREWEERQAAERQSRAAKPKDRPRREQELSNV